MIEMLVTLLIISGLLVLIMIGGQRMAQSSLQTESAFWESFDSCWKQALSEAEYHGKSTIVTIEGDQPIVFDTNARKKELRLPPSLHPNENSKLEIRKNATISPQTVVFHSDVDHRVYRLVIQMGWGVYHVDRTAA